MNASLQWLFWGGTVLVGWAYVGYPAVLLLLDRLPFWRSDAYTDALPRVALLISCHDEAAVIAAKLDNALGLDYPRDRLEIVVISDASSDATDEIVRGYADRGVRLIVQPERRGKTAGINLAMESVDAEIVVFSDANALYAPDAIRMLVRNFAAPDVGYVVGAALYVDEDESAAAMTENLYWRMEIAIKRMESRLHSVVGGDGAIYAIRKDLYQRLEPEDINDFVNPLQIIVAGYRGRFEPKAQCFEKTAGSFLLEARRKQRIVNRSFRGLMRVPDAMNPLRTGWFAVQVISHKLLRWLAPFILAVVAVSAAILAGEGIAPFTWAVLVMAGFVFLALLAHLRRSENIPATLAIPYYFFLTNLYSGRGVWEQLRGRTHVTWSSSRSAGDVESRDPLAGALLVVALAVFLASGLVGVLG